MRKKWSTLAFGFLVAAYAHIRIKEKTQCEKLYVRTRYTII